MTDLDFSSLIVQEILVTGPNGERFILREANGRAATDHRNAIMGSTQFGPDGKVVGIKDLASVEAKFIAACLWDDKKRNPPVTLIQSWPARVQKKLYEKVKELSEMSESSPLEDSLEKALQREDSPVSLEGFIAWTSSLPDEEFEPLKKLFEKRDLKNS